MNARTLHRELLLDVLKVVRMLCVERHAGLAERHVGVCDGIRWVAGFAKVL